MKKILQLLSWTILGIVASLFMFAQLTQAASPAIFTGEYFDNVDLSGNPVFIRENESIDFDWGQESPAPEVPAENFSVRWTGTEHFTAGQYRFLITGDDGVRLFIDGELIINGWVNQAATSYAAIVDLTEGDHQIIMEHYDGGWDAVAKLQWDSYPLAGQVNTLMPLGDSITHGYNVDGGYRTHLFELLPGVNFVGTQNSGPSELADRDHEGHPGWRIDEISSQIQSWLLSNNPETILLLIGTNDVLQNYQLATAPQRLEQLIDKILQTSPDVKLFVGTLPPLTNQTQNQQVQTFNQELVDLVNQKNLPNLFVVDIYNTLTTADLADGVHPNQAGYDKMADTWKEALNAVENGELPPSPEPNPSPTPTPTPTPLPEVQGYLGEYFNNINLSGSSVFQRDDAVVNFDWGLDSPSEIIPVNYFSARWSKTITVEEDLYQFSVTADDGVRLKIDGELVIDHWNDQSATTYTIMKNLSAGKHTIVMEYYEREWDAVAKLSWGTVTNEPSPTPTPFPSPQGEFLGQYFNNMNLHGNPIFQRLDSEINFDWGTGSPDSAVPVNYFSARWTQDADFESGLYQFTITGDDGIRLKIDDQVILDRWIDQGATTYIPELSLTAGTHTIVMEYYEREGDAVAKLNWTRIGDYVEPPPSIDYQAEYFNNLNLTGNPALSRTESVINYIWGQSAPAAEVNADGFSARWSATPEFEAGDYTFTMTADDGIRLFIDGQLVANHWINQSATTYQVTKTLTAGPHAIVLEYYDGGWDATAMFNWTKN